MPTIIAVDAMGTDKAPKPEVEGAILAVRHHHVEVMLVGPQEQLRAELALHPAAAGLPAVLARIVHSRPVRHRRVPAGSVPRRRRTNAVK